VISQAQVTVLRNAEELAQSAARMMSELMRRAIEERGICFVALAGGETPRRVYQVLAGDSHMGIVDWERVQIFFGDERMVPSGHADSNFGMAQRELLSRLQVPAEHVHRIQGERPPVDAAMEYEQELAQVFGGVVPRFDLITLGVGEDGHTASLFPHTPSVLEQKRNVLGYFVPQLSSWRVTLTLPVLLNARSILFFAAGRRKAEIIWRIRSAVTPSSDLPASMVRPQDGSLEWMLDAEAASLISVGGPASTEWSSSR
jgi:6-phosphogluconolactonase